MNQTFKHLDETKNEIYKQIINLNIMKAKEKYFGESNTEEINRIIESLRTQG